MAEKKEKVTRAERVEIGFDGGQVIAARIEEKQIADLREAAEKGDGWHVLETEDGETALDLGKVVFIRIANPEHRVGFSN